MSIFSIQEGYEWIARLQTEAEMLEVDVVLARDNLSGYGVAALEYVLDQTRNAIASISIEVALMESGGGSEDE